MSLPLHHELDPVDRKIDQFFCDECGEGVGDDELHEVGKCWVCENCVHEEILDHEREIKKLKGLLGEK